MKNILSVLFLTLSTLAIANNDGPIKDAKTINTEASSVTWVGKKVTGQHTGTINIKSGELIFDNGQLTGGTISMDMNSIICTDLGEGGARKLEGHLKSDDFFGVPNHPTATFVITSVKKDAMGKKTQITGDMTIKGITKSITFDADVNENGATADVTINRTDFDIRYGSGSFFDNLGDNMIYDDFTLALDLKY